MFIRFVRWVFLFFSAPGDYTPEKSDVMLHSSPMYTFGLKTQLEKPNETPGKNENVQIRRIRFVIFYQ